MKYAIYAFIVSAVVTIALGPVIIPMLRRLKFGFAVDMPHPEWARVGAVMCSSSFRTAYVSKYVGRAVSSMELLYKKQRNKWMKKYADTKKVHVCRRKEKMYALV